MFASDVIGEPGAAVTLTVGIVELTDDAGHGRPLAGEPVDFFLLSINGRRLDDSASIGTAESDARGRASLVWTPNAWPHSGATARYEVGARLPPASTYAAQVPIGVFVPSSESPILLVKLDADRRTPPKTPRSDGRTAVVSGARVLEDLAERYQVIYLTEIEAGMVPLLKAWVKRRGLPDAPVLLLGAEQTSVRIRKLLERNLRIRIGIGATAADARAFAENGLPAIIVPADASAIGAQPEDAWVTSNWTTVYGQILLCEKSDELLRAFDRGGDASREARRNLDRLGRAGVACVDRLRNESELGSAATYISGRLRANDAFWEATDWSTAEALRDSLLAAWRFGEPSVIRRLYADPGKAEVDPVPDYARWETLRESRDEGKGVVIYKLRLTMEDGTSSVREITCVRQPDSTWRIR